MRRAYILAISGLVFLPIIYILGAVYTDNGVTDGWEKHLEFEQLLLDDIRGMLFMCTEYPLFNVLVIKSKLHTLDIIKTTELEKQRSNLTLIQPHRLNPLIVNEYKAVMKNYTLFSIPTGYTTVTQEKVNCYSEENFN